MGSIAASAAGGASAPHLRKYASSRRQRLAAAAV